MKIYVGNLSYDVTEEELRQEFLAYRDVMSVSTLTDKFRGRPKGFGFVEMASRSEGEDAIASLKGKRLRGRVIGVVDALPLSDKRGTGSLHGRRGHRFNGKVRQEDTKSYQIS